jgi:selenocysteine-specific elongation factor
MEAFAPPTLARLAEDLDESPRELVKVLDLLARRGEVVRVDRDLWFASAAVDAARERLQVLLARDGEVRLAGFRDDVGCGRRNAQALLELFDREGLTLRRGDVRVARRRRG